MAACGGINPLGVLNKSTGFCAVVISYSCQDGTLDLRTYCSKCRDWSGFFGSRGGAVGSWEARVREPLLQLVYIHFLSPPFDGLDKKCNFFRVCWLSSKR